MITRHDSTLELKPDLHIVNKCFTATTNQKVINQFVWNLLLFNVLANRSSQVYDNEGDQVNSALT